MEFDIKIICYNKRIETDEILILATQKGLKKDIIKKFKKEIKEYANSFTRVNFRFFLNKELIYSL